MKLVESPGKEMKAMKVAESPGKEMKAMKAANSPGSPLKVMKAANSPGSPGKVMKAWKGDKAPRRLRITHSLHQMRDPSTMLCADMRAELKSSGWQTGGNKPALTDRLLMLRQTKENFEHAEFSIMDALVPPNGSLAQR